MNAIFTGRKRSGKTTLAFNMAMENGGGIIIYDPKREWRGWPATVTDVSQIPAQIKEHAPVIVFHPQGDKREAIGPLVEFVTNLHNRAMLENWDKQGLHFTLIVDEAVNVSTAHFIDDKMLALVAENRPEILNIFFTFQSPKDANNLLKSRVDNWYVFQTSLKGDRDYLEKEIGVPMEDIEHISHLREHEYAHFFFDGGTPKVDYNFEPESWFRPLEFFELNQNEREGIEMGRDRRENKELRDLVDRAKQDAIDDYYSRENRSGGRGRERERERGGRGNEREREREYSRPYRD